MRKVPMGKDAAAIARRGFAIAPVCILMLLFGWIVWRASGFALRAYAVSAVERAGGTLVWDYQWRRDGVWNADAVPAGNPWLRHFLGRNYASEVVEIQIFRDHKMSPELIGDREAAFIAALPKLQWLVLQDSKISDLGLKHLSKLKELQRLDLDGSRVTSDGVKNLQRALPSARIYY